MCVVTIIAKYVYEDVGSTHASRRIIIACIPNGELQNRYKATEEDHVWLAGRNAPLDQAARLLLGLEQPPEDPDEDEPEAR